MKLRPTSADIRFARLQNYDAATRSGLPQRLAAKICGISVSTAWRWRRNLQAGGLNALLTKKTVWRKASIPDQVKK